MKSISGSIVILTAGIIMAGGLQAEQSRRLELAMMFAIPIALVGVVILVRGLYADSKTK